jgi:hypothetical protein
MDKIPELFYDPKFGLKSAEAFYEKIRHKKEFKNVSKKEVLDWVNDQDSVQVLKHPKKTHIDHFPINDDLGTWQFDLSFMPKWRLKNKVTKQQSHEDLPEGEYQVILLAININSRLGFIYPLRNKTSKEVKRGFDYIFERTKSNPIFKIVSDKGGEFKAEFAKIIKDRDIEHIQVASINHTKLAYIDRFTRTVKKLFTSYFEAYNTVRWCDMTDAIQENYNNTKHSVIKKEPINMTKEDEKNEIRRKYFKTNRLREMLNLNLGDKVRVMKDSKKEDIFKKEGARYKDGIFTIFDKNYTSFKVSNEKGEELDKRYQHYELLKISDNKEYDNKDQKFDKEKTAKDVKIENKLMSNKEFGKDYKKDYKKDTNPNPRHRTRSQTTNKK